MLRPGDTIEYLDDVSSPPAQKGIKGQTKIIDRDIPMWTARFLLRAGKIRHYDPASPLQLEEEKPKKIKKGPDGPADISGPADKISIKKERRPVTNGQRTGKGKNLSEADQGRDHGIKSTKGGSPGRGG